MKKRIYLDCNATTGLDARVLEAMLSELSSLPSNPSSSHFFGGQAKERLQQARATIASFLHVKPQEIIFTSGGTEAMNTLIHGLLRGKYTGHLITSNVEHSAVHNPLTQLAKQGLDVSFLPAGLLGALSPDQVDAAIRPDTRFIILSAVNSETGVKHDLDAIAAIAQEKNIPLLVDGVSLLGKQLFTIPKGVVGMGFSAHKFHGPKGAGFIYLRAGTQFQPLLLGGEQEFGQRAGTENLPGIIGLAKAVEILHTELPAATTHMALLRDRLENGLLQHAGTVIVNGAHKRIANTCNLSFPNAHGEDLLISLDLAGIAVSHGSACTSGALEPSRILTNMGIPAPLTRSAIRFSLCRNTTEEEIDQCIDTVSSIVKQLRK